MYLTWRTGDLVYLGLPVDVIRFKLVTAARAQKEGAKAKVLVLTTHVSKSWPGTDQEM